MHPVEILLIEDSPSDAAATTEALEEGVVAKRIHLVGDGEEALEYLYKRGRYATATKPDLILLDLNLPKIDGHEVCRILKSDEDLRYIPIIVLTTSCDLLDVSDAYSSYANSYLTKPSNPTDFRRLVQQLEDFWLRRVRLPLH